jgi:hypothetical protein
MATTYSILGQAQSGTSATLLYSVPSTTSAVVSSIVLCNTTASAATVNVFCNKASTTNTVATALLYQYTIPAYTTQTFTLGITMTYSTAADTLYVQGGTNNAITATAFGSQIQ